MDCGLFLQEIDVMFRPHASLVDIFQNIRSSINQIKISRMKDGYHPTKNSSFNILGIAD